MTQASGVYALILAGGSGVRFGEKDKLWQALGDYPIWYRAVHALLSHPQIQAGGLVVPESKRDAYESALSYLSLPKPLDVLPCAGKTRQETCYYGLSNLPETFEWVAIHDAARPFVSQDLLTRLIDAAQEWGVAIPALPVIETVKRIDEDGIVKTTLERSELRVVQTPQLFRTGVLREAHREAREHGFEATDDAALIEKQGGTVYCVMGDVNNLKITTPEDLHYARNYLQSISGSPVNGIRVGIGYDIHSLAEGRRLILGGVQIEHSHGLLGHSDADVVTHAICDALLGAAALGDIGQYFPNTDPQWKDANSLELLRHVANLLEMHGWSIQHVDAMILAQAPRLSPHLPRMAQMLSETMKIQSGRVSLKATTMEGLGAIGREEGIACQAVATINSTFHKEEHYEQDYSQSGEDREAQREQ
jgi:2-C-methyl-D-erythritol 2,4-cyclodiphosphate synthase/2-C-methyl-D-erythritol 4-phosphate cytidylyltransferase